jgi:sodium-dependent dicarboxylate transporter 2/3/5
LVDNSNDRLSYVRKVLLLGAYWDILKPMPFRDFPIETIRTWLLLGAPLAAVATGFAAGAAGWPNPAAITLGITTWCALWWIFEPVPIPVTSLLPLALFPLLGVLTPAQVGQAYGSPLILLLLGGFILSKAMERSGAHQRLALNMVNLFGADHPRRVVFGFVVAAGVLSMWISNTATTLMLVPVALAVVDRSDDPELAVPLLLGIAYGASVGGIGTPIGTPPNLIFMQVYARATGNEPDFLTWMSWGVPVVVLLLPVVGWWLTRNLKQGTRLEIPAVGRWQPAERRVLAVFSVTALAWITRKGPLGGWSGLLDLPQANDASVALLAVVIMFMIPNGRGERLLDWNSAARIPWGVLILFGGGIAIASAFIESGLSARLGESLAAATTTLPLLLLIGLIALTVNFLTELTSNTATTNLLMPILAAAGIAAGMDPRLLMIPAAMAASCAFMLPVATAPNAIVFGSGRVRITDMMRYGVVLNLLATAVISVVCYWILA